MVELVGHDERVGVGQGDDHSQVGGVAGSEHQCTVRSGEVGEGVLELSVELGGAGDEAGRGRTTTPCPGGSDSSVYDVGMPREAEVVVASQVEHAIFGRTRPELAV